MKRERPTIPQNIVAAMRHVAELWRESDVWPRIEPQLKNRWASVVTEWVNDDNMPLIVRIAKEPPGVPIAHSSGRVLIPTDNSPAQWVYAQALQGISFSLLEIKALLEDDRVPVAMAIKAKHKASTKYFCNLAKTKGIPNDLGFKLGHIHRVGLGSREPVQEIPLASLKKKSELLLNPFNMFLVPTAWSGLSEIDEVITVFEKDFPSV